MTLQSNITHAIFLIPSVTEQAEMSDFVVVNFYPLRKIEAQVYP